MITVKLLQSHRKKLKMSGNTTKYNELRIIYPFEAIIRTKKPKEETFQKVHPYIWFHRIKLEYDYHWMFKTKKELDIFYKWRQNNEFNRHE